MRTHISTPDVSDSGNESAGQDTPEVPRQHRPTRADVLARVQAHRLADAERKGAATSGRTGDRRVGRALAEDAADNAPRIRSHLRDVAAGHLARGRRPRPPSDDLSADQAGLFEVDS